MGSVGFRGQILTTVDIRSIGEGAEPSGRLLRMDADITQRRQGAFASVNGVLRRATPSDWASAHMTGGTRIRETPSSGASVRA